MATTGICVQVYTSLDQIDQKITSNGFALQGTYTEVDSYYTHLNREEAKNAGYGILMNNTILLRSMKTIKGDKYYIIFKDKTLNSNNEVIKEEKISTQLENIENARRIFSSCGMYNWSRLVINQRSYIKGNLVINLQSVPELGNFLEITEYSSVLQGFSETKFKQLTYIANSLGLDLGDDYSVKKPYMKFKKTLTIGRATTVD